METVKILNSVLFTMALNSKKASKTVKSKTRWKFHEQTNPFKPMSLSYLILSNIYNRFHELKLLAFYKN